MKSKSGFRRIQPTRAAILWLAATILTVAGAQAKSPEAAATGTLDGKLTDLNSTPLAQAVVVVRNVTTGATLRGVTGKNGSYRFTGLGAGEYQLEASVPALGKGGVDGILVSAGHATRVQAALAMQLPNQALPIEADLHELDPVSAAVTTLIPGEELSSLPMGARNWQEFAAITPAASSAAQGENSSGQIGDQPEDASDPQHETLAMSGSIANPTAASIDGIENSPGFRTSSDRESRQTESVGESAVLSMEARTSNSAADQGRSSGGAIRLNTNQGHNGLHGQAFYFDKQNLWGAQNPYTQWVQQTAPASGGDTAQFTAEPYTPPNTRQTLGIGIGSNIRRDKLFWFAALDGLLRNDPAVASVRHPTDFFAQPTLDDLIMLAARLDLPGPAIEEAAATSYSNWLNEMAGLLGPVPRTASQWQGFGRLDWQNERQHVTVEGNATNVNAPAGALTRSSETYGSHSFGNSNATDTWGLAKLDSFLTPNLLNDVAALYSRHIQSETPQTPSAFEAPFLANALGQLPEIIADSKYGFILGKPARLGKSSFPDERVFVAQDTLSWVHGAHLLKAGASFGHIFDVVGTLVNQTGTYSYPNVLNFISDAASFLQYGFNGLDNPSGINHNCDVTGRVYATGGGSLGGLGYLPCYSSYSQRIGPSNWNLSTNDLAGFVTEQWQPLHRLTISAGVRVEAEQLPPPITATQNAALPATEKLPPTTLNWGPRIGVAFSPWRTTVLRLGAGLYYGRIDNSVVLAALTQTGSTNGDLNFFFRPTDQGAPPFPYVFPVEPITAVTPGAVSFASNFRPQEVDQAIFGLEQELPGHWIVSVEGMASLGRRLPISIDTNFDPSQSPQTITYAVVDAIQAGPIKTPQITVPFYQARLNPAYQQLSSIEGRANSTYQTTMIKLARYGRHGLNLRAHYLYAHATDWNPNESGNVAVDDLLDPEDFRLEYGTSNLDIRNSGGLTLLYETRWKLNHFAGAVANGWTFAAIGQYRSGLPFTMRTGGYIPGFYSDTGHLIEGAGPGINGSGGDNRLYGIGRNTYRYPATWTADSRLGKRFSLGEHRELEVLAESFNLFNHQNVTQIETTGYTIERGTIAGDLPTLNFLTGLTKTGLPSTIPEFGKPLDVNATTSYRPREIQLGVRTRF
ncbi:carboxypeptidase-like regulatory domain-containing protein [Acidicapsa acidisoli]|uniref:carboxypeptidase-like regulatory domain-containing protein n=1 Tax=Acidicapsa acidisoli TaxID=1615681 RepID=UPI0021DF74F6|nr:carboxypeptidase-like regulatory domain-containing protein [Acidicapsa acidisoli]